MQRFMAEDLFGKLLAIVFVAIILAALNYDEEKWLTFTK